MKVLIVSSGFPPSSQWGTEFYTQQLARGLMARGQEAIVFCPTRRDKHPRYTLERSQRHGVALVEMHNLGDPAQEFHESYLDEKVEAIFADLLASERPDCVHFLHLLSGLSVRLPELCRARGIPNVVTLTDFGLLCQRGHFFDEQLKQCGGPHPAAVCASCLREPGSFDASAAVRGTKRVLAHLVAKVGGAGIVVGKRDLLLRERIVREALQAVDHFIAPTRIMAYTFECVGIPRERLTQLYYAIEEAPFLSAGAQKLGRLGGTRPTQPPFRFGYLGSFEPHKGLHQLFAATALLARRLPEAVEPWCVHLHGAPVEGRHRYYVDWSWRRELAERIRFRGPYDPMDAPRILAGLDALIVPSLWAENAPLAVLQAGLMGLPLIAADVPGIREVLEPGSHTERVDARDAQQIADAMGRVLRAGRRREPVRAGPLSYVEHLERLEHIYRLLLEPGRKQATAALAQNVLAS